MVWVDVTGAIDGDSDGIVFEGTPMQRPIIPRAMSPKAQAGILQGASLPRAMQIERDRDNTGSRSKRNNEDGGKKRKFRPRLSAEEVRISQEQKLRSHMTRGKIVIQELSVYLATSLVFFLQMTMLSII